MIYYVTGIYFIVFMFFYLKNRTRLVNGFLFMIFILMFGTSMVMLADQTGSRFLFYLAAFLAIILSIIMTFSVFIIIITTFMSSIVLIKKEGFNLTNCLSLFSGFLFIGWMIINGVLSRIELTSWMFYGMLILNTTVLYLLFVFSNFLLSSLIYQFYIPILRQHYIIVLGSGLIDEKKVSPLLAGRIDRAIQVYKKQKKNPPMLIMSGGKGNDELISEGEAMKEYALKCGIDEEYILVENQSKNTYENLLFSKKIILDREQKKKHVRILFSTTNYHVFRAGIYASKVRLNANGIGASTKFYFWLNALLREYTAILLMNKKTHLLCLGIILLIVLGTNILVKENILMHIIEIILKFNG